MPAISSFTLLDWPWYWLASAALVATVIMTISIRGIYGRRLIRRPYLQARDVRLEMDFIRNELIVIRKGENWSPRFKFGTIVWTISHIRVNIRTRAGEEAPKTGMSYFSMDSLKLPEAFHSHTGLRTAGIHVHLHFESSLRDADARKVNAWLRHHQQQLRPDEEGYRAKLDEERQNMSSACRRHLPEAALFEVSSRSSEKAFFYAAFLKSGEVYGATGDLHLPVPVFRLHACVNQRLRIIFSNAQWADFELTSRQRDILQHLQKEALLTIEPPMPYDGP